MSSSNEAPTVASRWPVSWAAFAASFGSRSTRPTRTVSGDSPSTRSQARPICPAPTWTIRSGSGANGISRLLTVRLRLRAGGLLDRAGVAVSVEEVVGLVAQQHRNCPFRAVAVDPADPVGDHPADVAV